MRTLLVLLLLIQDPAARIRELAEKLSSERVEERDDAAKALREIGKPALPELTRIAAGKDAEAKARAERLIFGIGLRETFSDALRRAIPDLEDRVVRDGDRAWAEVFLEAHSRGVEKRDLETLAPRALCRATEADELARSCNVIGARRISSADPELFALLRHEEPAVRAAAVGAVMKLRHPRAQAEAQALLRSADPGLCATGISFVRTLGAKALVPEVAALVGDGRADVSRAAFGMLQSWRVPEAEEALVRLLRHPDAEARDRAAGLLALGFAVSRGPELLPLLEDPEARVRQSAANALAMLGIRQAIPGLRRLIGDPGVKVRVQVAFALGALGAHEALPDLLQLVDDPELEVHASAINGLAFLCDRGAIPALAKALADPNEWARGRALDGLRGLRGAPIPKVPDSPAQQKDSPLSIEELRRALAHTQAETREMAASDARRWRRREVLPELRLLLGDPSSGVRQIACKALTLMDDEPSVMLMVPLLRDSDGETRSVAHQCLKEMDSLEPVAELRRWLADPDAGKRADAVSVLTELAPDQVLPDLVPLLKDPDDSVRREALAALVALDVRSAIPAIRPLLGGSDSTVRDDAGLTLARLGDGESLPRILALLPTITSPSSVRLIVEALGKRGTAAAIPALRDLLSHDDTGIQQEAAEALGRLGDRSSLPQIRELLESPYGYTRHAAARTMTQLGARGTVDEFVKLADAPDDRFGVHLMLGFGRHALAWEDSPASVARWVDLLTVWNDEVRDLAEAALVQMKAKGAAPRLRAMLQDGRSWVRRGAASVLGWLGDAEAVPGLIALLDDPSEKVCAAAIWALERLGAGKEKIVPLLDDPRVDLRRWALGAVGTVDAAVRALGDRHEWVREDAVKLLGRLGAREAVPRLVERLDDPFERVREDAAEALCRLGAREGFGPRLRRVEEMTYLNTFVLNAVRQPELWRRLEGVGAESFAEGRVLDLITEAAGKAGLKVEAPAGALRVRLSVERGYASTTPSLLELLSHLSDRHTAEIVLEPGRIRFLSRREALKFWHDWAK